MTAFLRLPAAIACTAIAWLFMSMAPAYADQAAAPAAASEDQRLVAFFEEIFQRNLKDSPIFQAQLGMKGPDYGKWGDFSDAEAIRRNGLVQEDLRRLRAEFAPTRLSEQARISYRLF